MNLINKINKVSNQYTLDTLRYLPAKLIPAFVSFLWSYIFARIFSVESYGEYGLVLAVTLPIISMISEFSSQPFMRFYEEYKNNLHVYRKIIKRMLYTSFILILIIFGITYPILNLSFRVNSIIILAVFLNIILNSIYLSLLPLLTVTYKINLYRNMEIYRNLLKLSIALFAVFTIEKNIVFLIIADSIASLIVLLILLRCVFKDILPRVNNQLNINIEFKRFLKYGLPMTIWFLSAQLLNVGDRFVIKLLDSTSNLGIYTGCYIFITGITSLIGTPFILAAHPRIISMWKHQDIRKIEETIKNLTTFYIAASIMFIGFIYLTSDHIVLFFLGDKYLSGHVILVPTVAGALLWQLTMIGHKGIELYEKNHLMVVGVIIAALLNMILNVTLFDIFGFKVAAWTTLICYFLYACYIGIVSQKYIRWMIDYKYVLLYFFSLFITVYMVSIFTNNLFVKIIMYVLLSSMVILVIEKKIRRMWKN
ncbi:lipopolysaccharide biosynthesis protein [Priestia flexa]|uniref:lipopolysaccharide biosynthesis protein n=1 Tax=Priestia flexa TaxID=86664 RepID=UPI003CFF391F